MKRREFLRYGVALPLILQPPVVESEVQGPGRGTTSAVNTPRRDTPLLQRYHLTRDRVMNGGAPTYTQTFLLEDVIGVGPRRFTNFSGDLSGRWIGAASLAAAVYGDRFPNLDEVVGCTIALQHLDGYFGKTFNYEEPGDDDLALLWGNGRLLIGLLEYYGLTGKQEVLTSARKVGDFLLRLGPKYNSKEMADEFGASHFASSFVCWTQQTEGLAALYAATKDERYRALCGAIAERMDRRPADHVHGYLSSLRGTLDLHAATGDPHYLNLVEAKWQEIVLSGDVLVTGGVPEAWSPKKKRTEGCAECDWLRLNLGLWHATRDAKYIEMAERTLFNDFSMNQFATGDFGHAVLDDNGIPRFLQVRAWWCCTLHGLRAFPDVTRSVFSLRGKDISYDIPLDGFLLRENLLLTSVSTIGDDGTVTIHVEKASHQSLTIRQPAWAENISIGHKGSTVKNNRIEQVKAGDTIMVKYTMKLTQEVYRKDSQIIWYGPWLLGVASEVNSDYFNELHAFNKMENVSVEHKHQAVRSPFEVPLAIMQARYLPAEFPEQPQQLELRAIAEQTAMPSTPWQIAFKTVPS